MTSMISCPICARLFSSFEPYCTHILGEYRVWYCYSERHWMSNTQIIKMNTITKRYDILLTRIDGLVKLDEDRIEKLLLLK